MNKPVPKKTQAMNCIRILTEKIMDEYENSPDSGNDNGDGKMIVDHPCHATF